ncbi:hypothetical protein [Marinospirillum perlucidum]|uniref:hypothetical protein n=1 Tax=Marinospirillum perlucidum TaxID=1982602 RepID=UPI000DF4BFC7|nr:hypothetical protein [Marinospirillum perlucidum]
MKKTTLYLYFCLFMFVFVSSGCSSQQAVDEDYPLVKLNSTNAPEVFQEFLSYDLGGTLDALDRHINQQKATLEDSFFERPVSEDEWINKHQFSCSSQGSLAYTFSRNADEEEVWQFIDCSPVEGVEGSVTGRIKLVMTRPQDDENTESREVDIKVESDQTQEFIRFLNQFECDQDSSYCESHFELVQRKTNLEGDLLQGFHGVFTGTLNRLEQSPSFEDIQVYLPDHQAWLKAEIQSPSTLKLVGRSGWISLEPDNEGLVVDSSWCDEAQMTREEFMQGAYCPE